jgi:hypothetical protein
MCRLCGDVLVVRQIWSHKMLEVHNRIGGAAAADPPEQCVPE